MKHSSLRINYNEQDALFSRAFRVLDSAIAEGAFPGAAVAVTLRSEVVALRGFGRFTYETSSPKVAEDTVWDIASVSKVLATTAMAMSLWERGKLDLDAPLASLVPEFATSDPRRQRVTMRMLLTHSSGLPSYYRVYEQAHTPEELLQMCYTIPLEAEPGTRAEYSDIGFILLGVALERIAGEPLDAFCSREVFLPLDMSSTRFNPPEFWRERIPPTEDDQRFRMRVIQGEVNDENAFVLGGIAGHAGVFAPALDVAHFAQAMLSGGPIVAHETIAHFTRRESSPHGTSRALGWDTPSSPSQSGRYLSPGSFGHLGFTGTSLWCDPERELSVTFLTNRTWPNRECQLIKRVRPSFHDAVVESLGLV
ncbi:MAG TPA: serine hydrolase domain-containing protein [Terriglobales bacterium]|nr:serine hydrolase domain-containing protein [Terriglobales bacterium]